MTERAPLAPGSDSFEPSVWHLSWMLRHPIKSSAILLNILTRLLFGLFFFLAGLNKLRKGWLNSDILEEIFLQRLTELDPASFANTYLNAFALPLYVPIAYVITLGELAIGVMLILGLGTRVASIGAFLMLFNFAVGGYYDASLLPFFVLNLVFIFIPSGRWLGFDRMMSRRLPDYRWAMSG